MVVSNFVQDRVNMAQTKYTGLRNLLINTGQY